MGALSGGGADLALQVASGTLTGLDDAGSSIMLRGNFNISVWGTFVATVELERSFDGGTTWIRVTFSDGGILAYTAPASAVWSEAEYGVLFRLRCTAYTSGSINWRLSLGSDAPTSTAVNVSDGTPNVMPNAPLNILAATYNAATNTPTIADNGTGAGAGANNAYVVAVAGTVTVDSIGAVSIGDIIFNSGGAKWLRAPYSAVYKTMSLQDADDVAITGGSATGLRQVGFENGTSIQPSLNPDLAWGVSDSDGNIPLYLDENAKLFGVSIDFLSADIGTLAAETFTTDAFSAETVAAADVTLAALPAPMPGVNLPVTDDDGRVVSFYNDDGTFVVTGIDTQSLTISGSSLTSFVPADAVDVTNPNFGAVGDAVQNIGTVTITNSNTISITNFTGTLSLAQTTATTATLTLHQPDEFSGVAFAPYDVGSEAFLNFGTYTLQATITKWVNSDVVELDASAVTVQSTVAAAVTWPCFTASAAGKTIVLEGFGQDKTWTDDPSSPTAMADAAYPFGTRAYVTTISSVTSPTTAVLAGTPPRSRNGPAHILWGTNDTAAVCAAGQWAFDNGYRKLYFKGPNSLFLLPALVAGEPSWPSAYGTLPGASAGPTVNGVLWETDGSRVLAWDSGGVRVPKMATPVGADQRRSAIRGVTRGHLRRASQLSTINLVFMGDSQAVAAIVQASAAWSQSQRFVDAFVRDNPGKTVNIYWIGLGGQTFAGLAVNFIFTNSWTELDGFNVPRPISGTKNWYDLIQNLNQTGSGSAIRPDVVAFFQNGGNDGRYMDGAAMHALLNVIAATPHGDGYGPPDVIMETDYLPVMQVTTQGNGGGATLPTVQNFHDYAAGLIRSTAATRGLGIIDMQPVVIGACLGWSPTHTVMRKVPSYTYAATPTSPAVLPFYCRNFALRMVLSTADDAAVDIAISPNRGNKIMFRFDNANRLMCGVSAYGGTVDTTCTILSGGTALTVGTPTSLTGITYSQKAAISNVYVGSAPFTSGMAGQCIILPTGALNGSTYAPQRNFVVEYISDTNLRLLDLPFSGRDMLNKTGTFTIGGAHFTPLDSYSRPDVVIFYADGSIWNTQVAASGYTSATQATLASAAPAALSAATVPVFIGRMGVKWFDTGVTSSDLASGAEIHIDVNRYSMTVMLQKAGKTSASVIARKFIERFGGGFYPTITPIVNQNIVLSNVYVDDPMGSPVAPVCTPWELRGAAAPNGDTYYQGGVGGHPSSMLWPVVTDAVYDVNDLCAG